MTGIGRFGVLLAIAVVGIAALAWFRMESEPPRIDGPADFRVGRDGRAIALSATDADSGVRSLRVTIEHAGGETVVSESEFPGSLLWGAKNPDSPKSAQLEIDPKGLGIGPGSAVLVVSARDWTWRDGLRGNLERREIPLEVDFALPRIQVDNGLTYVRLGGANAVAYTVSEPTRRDGVVVGESFFRGYPAPGGDPSRRVALFAVPTDTPPNPTVEVIAEDMAGNVGRGAWAVVVRDRVLPVANVTLPQSFLDNKVRSLAETENVNGDDLVAAFDQINTSIRGSNEVRIQHIVEKSAESPLWTGAFAQMANSKVTSRFAEQRSYFVDGQKVSQATHFGYDLASTSGAPIEASNAGHVVFADWLGIYGNCVIVDHGLGLFTLYAHLSRFAVSEGDDVTMHQTLGSSGATGLAGGDHLHFAVIVGGAYVDPLEWWDADWVRTHIESRLAAQRGE